MSSHFDCIANEPPNHHHPKQGRTVDKVRDERPSSFSTMTATVKSVSLTTLLLISFSILSICLLLFAGTVILINHATSSPVLKQREVQHKKHTSLRKNALGSLQAAAQSFAMMSPIMAVCLMTPIIASSAGLYVPLSIAVAGVATLLTGRTVARFARKITSAGSLVTFVRRSLGPSIGAFCGVIYVSAIVLLTLGNTAFLMQLASDFFQFQEWFTPLIFLAVLQGLVGYVCVRGVETSTKIQLLVTGVSGAMCVLLGLVVYVRSLPTNGIVNGIVNGTVNDTVNGTVLDSGSGTPPTFGAFCKSVVYSLLIFNGYESATALSEETQHPHKTIPQAVMWTVGLCAIFYVVVSALLSYGYSTGEDWRSPSTLVTLATKYFSSEYIGSVYFLVVVVDGYAASVALVNVISRLMHKLAHHRILVPAMFETIHSTYATPYVATIFIVVGCYSVLLVVVLFGGTMHSVFLFAADAGGVLVQVSYFLVMIGGFVEFRSWDSLLAAMVPLVVVFSAAMSNEFSPGYFCAFAIMMMGIVAIIAIATSLPEKLAITSTDHLDDLEDSEDWEERIPMLAPQKEDDRGIN